MEILLVGLFFIPPALIGYAAANKNRNWVAWAVPAFLPMLWIPLGISVALVSHLCPKCTQPLSSQEKERGLCPRCGKIPI